MKNENTPSAPNEAPTAIAPYSKEQAERDQTRIATQLGCDKSKKISGMDYLFITLAILEEQGIADRAQRSRAVQVLSGMKANASALRQWLYEQPERKEAQSTKGNKYLDV